MRESSWRALLAVWSLREGVFGTILAETATQISLDREQVLRENSKATTDLKGQIAVIIAVYSTAEPVYLRVSNGWDSPFSRFYHGY